jgi:hypothetical protein
LYAEGQGIISIIDSSETVTWTGQGIGQISEGTRRDIGSIFCSTDSKGRLLFLNGAIGMFEN